MTTVIDEKLQLYKKCQIDMQALMAQKSQAVSQLNENILVKGVSNRLSLLLFTNLLSLLILITITIITIAILLLMS